MLVPKRDWPVLIVNLIYVPVFAVIAARAGRSEFLLYVAVVATAGAVVAWKQRTVLFSSQILWGLTLWGFMHLSGGNIRVGDGVLYDVILIRLAPDPFNVLRYDQVVHIFGFGVATLACHHLLRPHLRNGGRVSVMVGILLIMTGSGLGALNEVVEFLAVVSIPETNVGGYYNTAIDLVSNLIGATIATAWILVRQRSAH